jgi:hypothetical protein
VNLFERNATRTRPHDIWEWLMMVALLLLPVDVGVRRVNITREQLIQARAWVRSKLGRGGRVEIDEEAAASLAQLKDARTRVRLSDSEIKDAPPARKVIISKPHVVQAASQIPLSSKKQPQQSTPPADVAEEAGAEPLASLLLDARRKRRD